MSRMAVPDMAEVIRKVPEAEQSRRRERELWKKLAKADHKRGWNR